MKRAGMAIAGFCLVAALAGCEPYNYDNEFPQYSQRILTVTPGAGDTQAANTAIQTATPWPRHAFNKKIPANGALMTKAIRDYESGKSKMGGGGGGMGGSMGGGGGMGGGGMGGGGGGPGY